MDVDFPCFCLRVLRYLFKYILVDIGLSRDGIELSLLLHELYFEWASRSAASANPAGPAPTMETLNCMLESLLMRCL